MFDKLYIELGNDTLKYIYGSMSGKKLKIRKWGTRELQPFCFVNGKVQDEKEFISSLSGLRKDLKLFRSDVHLTVNDGSFITRPVELPILKEKDIEKHLSLEAEQYLPINKDNFQVSFRVMGRRAEADEPGSYVMVSAGPRDSIESILKCFDKCRLNVKTIDVYPNDVCRLLNAVDEDNLAVIDMGRKSINITIIENKRFYMHSFIPVNMEALLENCFSGDAAASDELRRDVTNESYGSINLSEADAQMDDNIREALSGTLGQVSRYLDYYNSRHFGKTVDCVYVIGENGILKGLKGVMSSSFNTRVRIGLEGFDASNTIENRSFLSGQIDYYSVLGMMLRGKKL